MNDVNIGLEGIEVGETAISDVQGDRGELSYRGYPIAELTPKPFVQIAWLLLFGDWPSARQESQLAHFLATHSRLTPAEIRLLEAIPEGTHPMLMLQGLVPLLDNSAREDLDLPFPSEDALPGLVIAAKLPSLVAAYYRKEQGLEWPLSSFSSDPIQGFLKNLHGKQPGEQAVETLKVAQILQMEHSYNAGTFAGRVVLSTQAPIASSISASIGTLFGSLHGGADQAALETAMAAGSASKAGDFVRAQLSAGKRIMGIGHREYRSLDRRATSPPCSPRPGSTVTWPRPGVQTPGQVDQTAGSLHWRRISARVRGVWINRQMGSEVMWIT